jgi:hypothetical protein
MTPSSAESLELAELPQFYADMFGWEELARDVSAVYRTLPEAERATAVVFARNYGEAGALEYYAPHPSRSSALTTAIGIGVSRQGVGTVIVLRGDEQDHRQACAELTLAAVHTCRYCMPYENNAPIYICRGLRLSLSEVWTRERSFH